MIPIPIGCSDGSIRLRDSTASMNGRVEVFATVPITTYSNPDMESMELVKGYLLMYVPIEDLVMNSSHRLYTP